MIDCWLVALLCGCSIMVSSETRIFRRQPLASMCGTPEPAFGLYVATIFFPSPSRLFVLSFLLNRIKQLWQQAQLFARQLARGQVFSTTIEIPTRDHQRQLDVMHALRAAIEETLAAIAARNAAQVRKLVIILCVCVCVCRQQRAAAGNQIFSPVTLLFCSPGYTRRAASETSSCGSGRGFLGGECHR